MNILVTNDDGYRAKGIKVLTEIMRQFGSVTVIAPKKHQSGMSMAVSLGLKRIAYKELDLKDGVRWTYLDATPASCVKFGLNTIFLENKPDIVVSGINHGSNASSASCYSGTLGAAEEAALNGVPAIGVSLDSLNPDADFSAVVRYFPDIFKKLAEDIPENSGILYNVNFPDIPADQIKGIRTGYQGKGRWIREFKSWDPDTYLHMGITPEMLGQENQEPLEEGETAYMMVGDFVDDERNTDRADHRIMNMGYISVVAHNVDTTDYAEMKRLSEKNLDTDFR